MRRLTNKERRRGLKLQTGKRGGCGVKGRTRYQREAAERTLHPIIPPMDETQRIMEEEEEDVSVGRPVGC